MKKLKTIIDVNDIINSMIMIIERNGFKDLGNLMTYVESKINAKQFL